MPKPKGLFPIGEIAPVCGISIDTLRFYETKELLSPHHIEKGSGYRYYNRENLLRLRTILILKDAGLSLIEIKDYLNGENETEKKLSQLTKRLELLNRAIDALLIRGTKPGELIVTEITLPERLCFCRTFTANDGIHAIKVIGQFYDELIRGGIPISRAWPEFCEYPDDGLLKGAFPVTDFIVTACLPVNMENAPDEAVLYPAGKAVAVNYRGSFYGLSEAYKALDLYMESHGYSPCGYPQEIYVEIGPAGTVLPDDPNYITRVIIPIKETERKLTANTK